MSDINARRDILGYSFNVMGYHWLGHANENGITMEGAVMPNRMRLAFLAATKGNALLLVMLTPVWVVVALVSIIFMHDVTLPVSLVDLALRAGLLLWMWLFLVYVMMGSPAWLRNR